MARTAISRRDLLRTLGVSAVGVPLAAAFGSRAFAQGRCMLTLGAPGCVTTPIKPVFEPTGWKTVALDHIAFDVADYKKEAAFYIALMNWKLRSDDGKQAVLDMGNWGSTIFRQAAPAAPAPPAPTPDPAAPAKGGRGGGRGGGASQATVASYCFVIEPWNAKTVEAELKKRGMNPIADNDGKGFESFRVKDPDGFDLQIANANGLVKARKTAPTAKLDAPLPFEPTNWNTVWLDHFSFGATNYKESASFYQNLLGWTETYDEGSQNEMMMGDVGNSIIRGGNPLAPVDPTKAGRGAAGGTRQARIDHISFGITPWDSDAVKAELDKRGLTATIDTSSRHQDASGQWVADDVHTAAFRSYHTRTPNGYNLQISWVTKERRLNLSNAVRPHKS